MMTRKDKKIPAAQDRKRLFSCIGILIAAEMAPSTTTNHHQSKVETHNGLVEQDQAVSNPFDSPRYKKWQAAILINEDFEQESEKQNKQIAFEARKEVTEQNNIYCWWKKKWQPTSKIKEDCNLTGRGKGRLFGLSARKIAQEKGGVSCQRQNIKKMLELFL